MLYQETIELIIFNLPIYYTKTHFYKYCLPLFLCTVDRTAVYYGHTTVIGRPMVGGNALSMDSIVFKHGIHHEGFDGGRRKI